MSDQFIGEIRPFAGNFAPQGWALCDGRLLPIVQNQALFALIGTTYGGDGQNTFALPDLRGRVAMHQGGRYSLGQQGGAETVTLTEQHLPTHTHSPRALSEPGTSTAPGGMYWASRGAGSAYSTTGTTVPMAPGAIAGAGNSQAHENMMPFLTVNFIIALEGEFPVRE